MEQSNKAILLVDDEPSVRRILEVALHHYLPEFDVWAEGDGLNAIYRMVHFGPTVTLIITDVVMPGMNGIEMLRQLLPTFVTLRAVVISGYPAGHYVEAFPFLSKPFQFEELLRCVREVLGAPLSAPAQSSEEGETFTYMKTTGFPVEEFEELQGLARELSALRGELTNGRLACPSDAPESAKRFIENLPWSYLFSWRSSRNHMIEEIQRLKHERLQPPRQQHETHHPKLSEEAGEGPRRRSILKRLFTR